MVGPSNLQASKHTGCNEVTLVWGRLRMWLNLRCPYTKNAVRGPHCFEMVIA